MSAAPSTIEAPAVPEGAEPPIRRRRKGRRYAAMLVAGLGVFALSTALGQVAHGDGDDTLVPSLIARCQAINGAHLTHDNGGHFTDGRRSPSKVVKHPDGSWVVYDGGMLTGYVQDGRAMPYTATAQQTCSFSRTAALSPSGQPETVRIVFRGPFNSFDLSFTLIHDGTYTSNGWGTDSAG